MVAAPPILIHPGAVDLCGLRGFSRPDAPPPAMPRLGPLGMKKERRSPRRPFPVKICENSRPPSRRPCPLSLDIPGFSHVLPSCPALSRLSQLSCLFTNAYPCLHFRISLRSDVYFLVRTADESTDKIEGNVIWLSWTEHELLVFLAKRVQSYLGNKLSENALIKKPQFEIAKELYPIMESHFMGEGKWNNKPIHYILLSLTRRRPRDLINLCTQAAREACDNHHSKISTDDWEAIFSRYSQNRLQDTINEHRYELPDIRRLLLGMKPSHDQRKLSGSHKYTEEQLIRKISGIMQNSDFVFANGQIATEKELLTFMYKINFLVARKDLADGYIDRKYFEDNNYLSTENIEFGYDWEVHPAFRWALYPEARDIFSGIDLPNLV